MFPRIARSSLVAAVAFALTPAAAQIRPAYEFPTEPDKTGPAYIQLGSTPLRVAPEVTVAAGRDDNVLFLPDAPITSPFYTVSPGLTLDARTGNHVLQARYLGEIARYTDSHDDDYEDHTLTTSYDVAIGTRNFLRVGYDYLRAHDPRGLTDRPIGTGPDEYDLKSPHATYAFGTPGARGRIELYYAGFDRKYRTNREVTRFADRKTHEYGGAFYFRVGAKTRLLAEVRETDINYREDDALGFGGGLDSDERRYFGGVSWEPTAATSGTFKFGRIEKRFKGDGEKHSEPVWEATINWMPRAYSTFVFTAARTTSETTGLGRFIFSDIYTANWRHAWSDFLASTVTARYQKDDYQDFNRQDDTTAIGLRLDYRVRRWLTLGAEYVYNKRDSSFGARDYDKNIYLISATATL